MPVLVTCKFDKDPINNECASVEPSFSHYSLWEFFPVLKGRARNTEVHDPTQLEFEVIRDFTPVLDTCKFGEDPIKND